MNFNGTVNVQLPRFPFIGKDSGDRSKINECLLSDQLLVRNFDAGLAVIVNRLETLFMQSLLGYIITHSKTPCNYTFHRPALGTWGWVRLGCGRHGNGWGCGGGWAVGKE